MEINKIWKLVRFIFLSHVSKLGLIFIIAVSIFFVFIFFYVAECTVESSIYMTGVIGVKCPGTEVYLLYTVSFGKVQFMLLSLLWSCVIFFIFQFLLIIPNVTSFQGLILKWAFSQEAVAPDNKPKGKPTKPQIWVYDINELSLVKGVSFKNK